MATLITKNSQTAGAVPSAASLAVGELAVNTADGKLYTEHTGGVVKEIIPSTVADGGITLAKITATGTPSSSTFLRGDGSWSSASADSLRKNFNLSSGTSAVLGRALLVDTNGEVGQYPALNSVGSFLSNTVVDYYDCVSLDGSTAISFSTVTSTNTTYTVSFRGTVVNQTGAPVTGSNTVNLSAVASGGSWGYGARCEIYPINNNTFIAFVGKGAGSGGTEWYTLRSVVLTVDTSTGSISAGSETTIINNIAGSPGEATNYLLLNILRASPTVYIIQGDWAGGLVVRDMTVSVSGTSISSVITGGASANNRAITTNKQVQFTLHGALITSSNLVVSFSGNSVWRGQYTPGSATLTSTVSNEQVIFDAANAATWIILSPTRVIASYYATTNTQVFRSYSVNQTTGALTLLGSLALDSSNAYTGFQSAFKSSTEIAFIYTFLGVVYFRAAELNSDGTFKGASNPLATTVNGEGLRYNTSNFFAHFTTLSGPDPAVRRCTVNAFSNRVLEAIGFPTSTTSSSPVSVIVGGVAGGFTGLTPATRYFLSTAYDGTITTSNASGISVGTAISTTEIKV
jgi:hypothetical protein